MSEGVKRNGMKRYTSSATTPVALEYFPTLAKASETTKYAVASTAGGMRPSRVDSTVTGTVDRSARDSRAGPSPRSVRIAGWIPRASSRRSFRASVSCSAAWSIVSPTFEFPSGPKWCRAIRRTRSRSHRGPKAG